MDITFGIGHSSTSCRKRNDWVYILDFSIQLGSERCLLILGVSNQTILENGYTLQHKQVQVLDIFVKDHFDGNLVKERLSITKNKTGTRFKLFLTMVMMCVKVLSCLPKRMKMFYGLMTLFT